MLRNSLVGCVLLVVFGAACSDTLGSDEQGQVGISFRLTEAATAAAQDGELVITGSNGTLRITDISLIVHQFELEGDDDVCDNENEGEGGTECEDAEDGEFETGPRFVRLPLNSQTVTVTTEGIPQGTFTKLEFEVENLDFDEDDDDAAGDEASVAAAVHAAFPQWPDRASMVVVGTFTPAGGGDAKPFITFFDAEIEIEKTLDPALVVNDPNETVTVELDPSAWFRRPDGTVLDLSAIDFATTGIVLEFELELENGFTKAEGDED
jgi:hypothetical protein